MPLTDHERALFVLALKRITTGRLPNAVPESLLAGYGTGAPCSLCEYTIDPAQVEYELPGHDGVTFHFHLRCHAMWQLAADDKISGSQASPVVSCETGKSYRRFGLCRFRGSSARKTLTSSIVVPSGGEHVSPYQENIYGDRIVGCFINGTCPYLRALRRGRRSLRAG
jgi:hypothetical protein